MHTKVFAGLGGGSLSGVGSSHFYFVEQLGLQDGLVGGFPGVGVVEDACDLTLSVVERDTCPLTVGVYLGTLDLEVLGVVGDESM